MIAATTTMVTVVATETAEATAAEDEAEIVVAVDVATGTETTDGIVTTEIATTGAAAETISRRRAPANAVNGMMATRMSLVGMQRRARLMLLLRTVLPRETVRRMAQLSRKQRKPRWMSRFVSEDERCRSWSFSLLLIDTIGPPCLGRPRVLVFDKAYMLMLVK
jgi:hypothetical protein